MMAGVHNSFTLASTEGLDGPAATELLRVLIKYLHAEFSQKAARNVHSSLRVVVTADQLNNDIQSLIKALESETDYTKAWPLFQKYSSAIDPLESALLDLSFVETVNDQTSPGHLPPSDNIAQGVTFIERWVAHRELITNVLKNLAAEPLKAVSPQLYDDLDREVTADFKYDESVTLSELSKAIGSSILSDRNVAQRPPGKTNITNIKALIQRIYSTISGPNDNSSYELRTLVIRTAMLICVAFSVLCNPSAPRDIKKRLRETAEIWTNMNRLSEGIEELLSGKAGARSIKELEREWSDLRQLLLGNEVVNFLPDLLQIIKGVARVRRPFIGRAFVFVHICQVLCEHYDKADAADPEKLKEVMKGCSDVLRTATDAVTDLKMFDTESDGYKHVKDQFETTTKRMGEYFSQYDVTGWKGYEDKMKIAAEQDEKYFKAFRKRIENAVC